jgi:hypothetical protein
MEGVAKPLLIGEDPNGSALKAAVQTGSVSEVGIPGCLVGQHLERDRHSGSDGPSG